MHVGMHTPSMVGTDAFVLYDMWNLFSTRDGGELGPFILDLSRVYQVRNEGIQVINWRFKYKVRPDKFHSNQNWAHYETDHVFTCD